MNSTKALLVTAGVMALSCLSFSCKKEAPQEPPHEVGVQLSVEDASCTEAWLKVSLLDASQPRTVALLKDGQRVLTAQMTTADSVFVVEGLLPRHTYSYVAQRLRDTSVIDVSSPVQATTMDTTSHDWVFSLDTLGVTASSLQAVEIVNDSLAYAVGEMYLNDSTGNLDPIAYNAAKWNGSSWELLRIAIPICGSSSTAFFSIYAVFAPGQTEIWFSGGGDIEYWNGITFRRDCSMNSLIRGGITNLWASSPTDLYAVGGGGTILHYRGVGWEVLEGGTTLPIRDVLGAKEVQGEDYEILCVADSYGSSEGSKILSIKNGIVRALWNDGRPYGLDAVWFVPGHRYVVVGSGVWVTRTPGGGWVLENMLPAIHTTSIAGQGLNDYVACGAFGLVAHNNGVNWRTYFPMHSGSFTSVSMKGNLMLAVGGSGDRAIIARGTRSHTR